MDNRGDSKKPFLQTMPGILMGVAAVITAIATLVGVLWQTQNGQPKEYNGGPGNSRIETEAPQVALVQFGPVQTNAGRKSGGVGGHFSHYEILTYYLTLDLLISNTSDAMSVLSTARVELRQRDKIIAVGEIEQFRERVEVEPKSQRNASLRILLEVFDSDLFPEEFKFPERNEFHRILISSGEMELQFIGSDGTTRIRELAVDQMYIDFTF
jgi:hypothetical protein